MIRDYAACVKLFLYCNILSEGDQIRIRQYFHLINNDMYKWYVNYLLIISIDKYEINRYLVKINHIQNVKYVKK